jgi:lipid II:glycine glycyltransferase (peptidoglycan interpeptide bridge formation enzyme)
MAAAGTGRIPRFRGLVPADLTVCDGAEAFLQSAFWGTFKARFGWTARAFLTGWEEAEERPLMVIRRRLKPGLSFAYVPWGPELPPGFPPPGSPEGDGARKAALEGIARALKGFLPGDAFIRFDPPWYTRGPGAGPPALGRPFVRAAGDIQPPDSAVVDLCPPAEDILGGMKPKWRYNIRLAEKKGVAVRRAGEEETALFYALFKETARRDHIAIHSAEYYAALFAHRRDYPGAEERGLDLRLYLAEHEGAALAAVIVLFWGSSAVYLYGASSDHKRNLMAPYALQWRAMEDAKEAGCLEYDLFGIPPEDDPRHPMAGLYRFKTGFGGSIIHRAGSWDYTCRPFMKNLFSAAEAARKSLRSLRKR